MQVNRKFGAILMTAGVLVGAGMLALPIATAAIGPLYSLTIMLLIACVMLYSGLVTAELNFIFGDSISIATMAEKSFGKWLRIISIWTIATLFYSLVCAYLSGMTSILQQNIFSNAFFSNCFITNFQISDNVISTILALFIGYIVFGSAQIVDYSNRFFFSIKLFLLTILLILLIPYVKIEFIFQNNANIKWKEMALLIPLFFTSFGFHGSIPSILKYVGHEKKQIKQIFTFGVLIPYCLYSFWIYVTIGSLPLEGQYSLQTIQNSSDSLRTLFDNISGITGSKIISYIAAGFSFCMITSLLGVTLGLVDFFIEIFNYDQSKLSRFKAILWTFLPPIFILLMKSKVFISALSFAAIALSILAIIIPCSIAWHLINQRKKTDKIASNEIEANKIKNTSTEIKELHFCYINKSALFFLLVFGYGIIFIRLAYMIF